MVRFGAMADGLPDLDSLQRDAMAGLLETIVFVRLIVGPILATILMLVVWLDPQPWRVWLGLTLIALITAVTAVEYVRFRKGWSGPRSFPPNAVAMVFIQLGGVALTGGIDSPILVVVPVAIVPLAIVVGPSRWLALAVTGQALTIWTFVVLRTSGIALAVPQLGEGSVERGLWTAIVLSIVLLGAIVLGSKIRRAVTLQFRQALAARDSERVAHEEHVRELAALSGEIAHELKNPLASIKGLAALLAKDLDGKAAERMTVLRSEVERMQETLDSFLTFSRPLVPLAQTPVDAQQLAEEVASLCEGLALGRGVSIQVAEGPARLRADRRKLRQVLVNLVQNAIEASPPGSAVTLRAVAGDPVVLEVLDRGAGLPDLAPPSGVSTKERGSGLGLPIARVLVGQHTGTLDLSPRPGGGTVARVTLPAAGAP